MWTSRTSSNFFRRIWLPAPLDAQVFRQVSLDRLLRLDAALSARLRIAERPGPLRTSAGLLAHSGDSWVWGLLLLAAWQLGGLEWLPRVRAALIGILVTAAVVQGLKLVFRRRRPEGQWGKIYRLTDPHSFPSGHAARAILLAVLGLFLGPTWLAVALLLWAPLVVLARVAMGVHYVSDVAVGAVLGGAVGLAVGVI